MEIWTWWVPLLLLYVLAMVVFSRSRQALFDAAGPRRPVPPVKGGKEKEKEKDN